MYKPVINIVDIPFCDTRVGVVLRVNVGPFGGKRIYFGGEE